MVSAMFLTAIQRRHGLYLSVIAPTLVEKAAAGEHVTVADYKGDSLANSNKGDRTSKHNGVQGPPRMPSGRARLAASSSGIRKSPR